jgi:transcriptional regulator of arginine metabolism
MRSDAETPNLARPQRLRRVAELIRREPVVSQEDLAGRLAAAGLRVTQATVSRDLAELGAVKVRRDGVLCYALPGDTEAATLPEARVRRLLSEWIERVEAAGPMVVLRTPPGSAHLVASALDHAGWPEIAGTVAGDDTIVIVVRDGHGPASLADKVSGMIGPAVE